MGLGYLLMCEESMRRFDFSAQAHPVAEVARRLTFTPTSIAGTRFATLELLGAIAELRSQEGTSAVRWVFGGRSGEVVTLLEWDMTASGGNVGFMRENGWIELRGTKGQATVVLTPWGKAHSEIAWVERGRLFEVTVDRALLRDPEYTVLRKLAESLP